MVCEHMRNSREVEPRVAHECDPSLLEGSLEGWIGRDRDVRIEAQPARLERREHLLDEPLLVLDVMDREERHHEIERTSGQ